LETRCPVFAGVAAVRGEHICLLQARIAALRESPLADVLKLFRDRLEERRQAERFPIEFAGVCLVEGLSYPCSTVELSGSGLSVKTSLPAERGEQIIADIPAIGAIEGTIARRIRDGFAIHVEAPASRELLARTIASLVAEPSPAPVPKGRANGAGEK